MKTGVLLIAALLLALLPNEVVWLSNFDLAKDEAKAQNKHILLSFTGSDWCANCKRLDNDLFSTSEFAAFANENLVLLQLDFPAKKQNKLSDEQSAHNEALAEKYNKSGTFPTVLILDASGKVIGKMKHPATTAEAYIASIQSLIN